MNTSVKSSHVDKPTALSGRQQQLTRSLSTPLARHSVMSSRRRLTSTSGSSMDSTNNIKSTSKSARKSTGKSALVILNDGSDAGRKR